MSETEAWQVSDEAAVVYEQSNAVRQLSGVLLTQTALPPQRQLTLTGSQG